MAKRLVLLTTDTLHHRYFCERLSRDGIAFDVCFLEREHLRPPFDIGPFYEEEEFAFERERFGVDPGGEFDGNNVVQVRTMNTEEARREVARIRPDLGVVFGTGKLSGALIDLFPDGLLNVHRGIAQEYRGLDSDYWAIYHGDYDNLGVTIHKVEPALDTGPIAAQRKLRLTNDMRIYHLRYFGTVLAAEMMRTVLKGYIDGAMEVWPQGKRGRYYSFMPLVLRNLIATKFHKHCSKLEKPVGDERVL